MDKKIEKTQHENDLCAICKQPLETSFCVITTQQPTMEGTVTTNTYNVCYNCYWKLREYMWKEREVIK